jgi:hypothetical protein
VRGIRSIEIREYYFFLSFGVDLEVERCMWHRLIIAQSLWPFGAWLFERIQMIRMLAFEIL